MTETDAIAALEGADLVTYARVTVRYGKEVIEACRDAGVPAALARDASCSTGGCSPKVAVVVRREDVRRVAAVLGTQWVSMARAEGDLDPDLQIERPAAAADAGDEPPCPACGTAAPLVEGACSDCGLVLE